MKSKYLTKEFMRYVHPQDKKDVKNFKMLNKIKIKCPKCGVESTKTMQAIKRGCICKYCGILKRREQLLKNNPLKDKILSYVHEDYIFKFMRFPRNNKVLVKCVECGEEKMKTIHNILYGHFCIKCSRKKVEE